MPRQRIKKQVTIQDPWQTLSGGIKDTLSRKQSELCLSTLHKACGILVGENKYDLIFEGLLSLLKEHFNMWHVELSDVAGNPLIVKFSNIYDDFKNYCSIFPKFYMLYDRHFPNQKNKTLSAIRRLFIDIILSDKKLVLEATTPSILKDIAASRSGGDVDLAKIFNLVSMYYSFSNKSDAPLVFNSFFQKLCSDTESFYNDFFKAKYNGNSFPVYLSLASKQFAHEEHIINEIIKNHSEHDGEEIKKLRADNFTEIMTICHQSLLVQREDQFLIGDEPPISIALTADDQLPMKWLVDTYQRFRCELTPVFSACSEFIKSEMLKLTSNFPDEKPEEEKEKDKEKKLAEKDAKPTKKPDIATSIGQLIDLTRKLTSPYVKIFNPKEVKDSDRYLRDAIKAAWNNPQFKIVENFCIYIDSLIKSEFKNVTIDNCPEVISQFYTYLTDRRAFDISYEAFFVRRLIKLSKKLPDLEYPIISAIRKHSTEFLTKYDNYIKQLNDSLTLEEQFKSSMSTDSALIKAKLAISPLIFQTNGFPLPKVEEKNIPPVANTINRAFTAFFLQSHPLLRLTLLASSSTIEFKLQVPKNARNALGRAYAVVTDIPCAFVLSAVAEKPKTFKEIIDLMNGDRNIAGKVLLRLNQSSNRIISRTSTEKKLLDTDVFQLNPAFAYPNARVVIQPIFSEVRASRTPINQRIEAEKVKAIQAAAVRTLKQRFSLEQGQLEMYVVQALAEYFQADISMIRREITELESNNYLNRKTVNGEMIVTYQA